MVIGCLGDIVFQASSDLVKTINNLKETGSARYATHQLHARPSLIEFVGSDPEIITFDMELSAYLGVDPLKEYSKIQKYTRSGKTLALTLGDRTFGRHRWCITKYALAARTYAGDGNITSAKVTVTLQEYLRS